MEQVKRKRGRPRKNPLPEEIQQLVQETYEKQNESVITEKQESIEYNNTNSRWDISINQSIDYFDPTLSYELTGYRPINDTQGLDFNPEWFIQARKTYQQTGHYSEYLFGSKAFADFWDVQFDRCRNGMESHGYKITGDHYFFLNFYQLPNLNTAKAGVGRAIDFPDFYVAQYEWFHYLEMCKLLRKNAALMKARGLILAPLYSNI